MNCVRFETSSVEETLSIGRRLGVMFPGSGVVCLIGNLGAGKTTLTKGIVEGRQAARAEDVDVAGVLEPGDARRHLDERSFLRAHVATIARFLPEPLDSRPVGQIDLEDVRKEFGRPPENLP